MTGDGGPGSAQGVGVSGCELWDRVGRAGCDLSGGRVRARSLPSGVARGSARDARPMGRARVWDGDPRQPAGPAVPPPRGPASPESRGGGAARGHHFLRAGDTPPGRHGGAEAAVAARGSSCTCITGAAAVALLLCGFFPC